MNLFINDTPVKLIKQQGTLENNTFDKVFSPKEPFDLHGLTGTILIENVTPPQVRQLMNQLIEEPFLNVEFYIQPKEYKQAKTDFMNLFKVVDAAGGVVQKNDEHLLIYRLGKWDFPKGKLEKEEKFKHAAVREVEEETGLKVLLEDKICTTWHTYTFRKKRILKRTKWYRMSCLDDANMAPQKEENIEQVVWCTPNRVSKKLKNTYNSIRFIWHQYQDQNSIS